MPNCFTALSTGQFDLLGLKVPCALGKGGVIVATEKREGDNCSPLGIWPIRRVLYRPDREPCPQTDLPVTALRIEDGWCDDVADPAYNQPVQLPYAARHERLWRDDGVYDLIVVLGHNDDPPVPGLGSAIFLHLARPDFTGTEGCVALRRDDLLAFLRVARLGDTLAIVAA